MERMRVTPRFEYEQLIAEDGINYQGLDGSYWFEDRAYLLTASEEDSLRSAVRRISVLLVEALSYVIKADILSLLGIPPRYHGVIQSSWERREPSLFSRLDFVQDRDGRFRLLECNGDTPITLVESGIVQERWRRSQFPDRSQMNDLELALGSAMRKRLSGHEVTHFLAANAVEEIDNVQYLRRIALGEGIRTRFTIRDQLQWDQERSTFVDGPCGEPVSSVLKLYPWEWLLEESDPNHAALENVSFLEPAWKIPLCSKGILAILWELFPGDEVLVPSYLESPRELSAYVAKPLFGRKGDSMVLVRDGIVAADHQGAYASQDRVYQEFIESPLYSGWRATLGAWLVDDEPCGLGIRESREFLMRGESVCVPHLVTK